MVVLSIFILGCVGGMALAFIALDARIAAQARALRKAVRKLTLCEQMIVKVANRDY